VPQFEWRLSVFLLVRSLEAGGAERQLVELARGLQQRGHKVTVATFYKRGPLVADLERAGVPIVDLRKAGRWDAFAFLARARQAVRRSQPDIIYTFLGGANLAGAAIRTATPEARLVWSIRSSDVDFSQYDWLHLATHRLERLLSSIPALIIANSRAGRDNAITNGFPGGRIAVVPNGIDASRFKPDEAMRQKQRAEWRIGDGELVVGVLARLDPMKGHALLLKAAARVADVRRDVRFVCVGAGSEQPRLRALAADLRIGEIIHFVGDTDDPVAALNAFDVYCSPSVSEGFPNAIAEAMACGLPCLVTDVGDSARIVGDTGLVVARNDPAALTTGILQMIDLDRERLAVRARQRIVDCFSLDAMVDRTAVLLRQTLSVDASRA